MVPKLYWIERLWPGHLAISARPRGGDWLDDEVVGWRKSGIDAVISLLTTEENTDLDLSREADVSLAEGIKFLSFLIADRGVPNSQSEFSSFVTNVRELLKSGRTVAIHCRQGIGRSGLLAAALVAENGINARRAMETVSTARGLTIPETGEQRDWLQQVLAHENSAFPGTRGR